MVSLRKTLTAVLTLASLSLGLPAHAETIEESVVRQLRAQGFTEFEVERTLLGRLKIEAKNATLEREIVINPTTGEILRDYWEYRSGGKRSSGNIVIPTVGNTSTGTVSGTSGSSGSGSTSATSTRTTTSTATVTSSSNSGSSHDDDDEDDHEESSNSGKGSSNSGRDNDREADRDDDRDDDKGRDDDD